MKLYYFFLGIFPLTLVACSQATSTSVNAVPGFDTVALHGLTHARCRFYCVLDSDKGYPEQYYSSLSGREYDTSYWVGYNLRQGFENTMDLINVRIASDSMMIDSISMTTGNGGGGIGRSTSSLVSYHIPLSRRSGDTLVFNMAGLELEAHTANFHAEFDQQLDPLEFKEVWSETGTALNWNSPVDPPRLEVILTK